MRFTHSAYHPANLR